MSKQCGMLNLRIYRFKQEYNFRMGRDFQVWKYKIWKTAHSEIVYLLLLPEVLWLQCSAFFRAYLVYIAVQETIFWNYILMQFMKERSHINAQFVTKAFQETYFQTYYENCKDLNRLGWNLLYNGILFSFLKIWIFTKIVWNIL